MNDNLTTIAKQIKLLILDCDGVLTDGRIYFDAQGEESISFHVHDGLGMKRLQASGVTIAVISSRETKAVIYRLKQLNIHHIFLGQKDKTIAYHSLLTDLKITSKQVAYVGDDLPDLPVMSDVGLAITVANAMDAAKKIAHFCTQKKGGRGAVREVCDFIYAAQHA